MALGSGLKGSASMTTEQGAEILKGQTAFVLSAVEAIRKELVSYGMAVSNLVEQTRIKREELGLVAEWIFHGLDKGASALPKVFFKIIDKHECYCDHCNPNFRQTLICISSRSRAKRCSPVWPCDQ